MPLETGTRAKETPAKHSSMPQTLHLDALGFRMWRHSPPSPMPLAHTHPDVELNYVHGDSITYLHGGLRQTVESGTLAVFWAGIPHQTLRPPAAGKGIWIYLPLPWLVQWKLPNDFAGQLLAGKLLRFPLDPAVLSNWLAEHESSRSEMHQLLQLELQTTLTRLALTLPPHEARTRLRARSSLDGGDRHIARVTSYLASNYAEAVTIDDIAAKVGLNRSYLMQLFRRHCHMSIWEYLTRLRVSHAQRLLTTSNMRVLDIALECGFGSLGPFYSNFARYCGHRPLDFRHLHQDQNR